jgi:flavorubredoxin
MAKNKPKALLLYWSATGNTEKVARAIEKSLKAAGLEPVVKKIAGEVTDELYDYDLVFLGCPSYSFAPPPPVLAFVERKMKLHREHGDIKPGAPEVPGKTAVIFVTYSGPHTGINEATPAGDFLGQLFEHLGFKVAAKWYQVGEFHGNEVLSTKGRLGDIRGRPNAADLAEVEANVTALLKTL